MTGPVRDRWAMIAAMDPQADPVCYAFVGADDRTTALDLMRSALATFREDEGLSLVVPHDVAMDAGIETPPYARITLQVHSALDGVGLTAAVANALAEANIACNVIAAMRHDHIFVPAADKETALAILQQLQAEARP